MNAEPAPPRVYPDALPVTGAWRLGDDVGCRQFVTLNDHRPFALEGGGALRQVTLAYETWGTLAADASNAVLVCHALTGDSHASGRQGNGHATAGWWDDMIGPGKPLDTDRVFVVCMNVLGGCQGSTGPASIRPPVRHTGRAFPWSPRVTPCAPRPASRTPSASVPGSPSSVVRWVACRSSSGR